MSTNMNRRSFLAGAAAVGAATVASTAFAGEAMPPMMMGGADAPAGEPVEPGTWRIPPEPIADDQIATVIDADVLVIGLGHAGSCALRAAAEQGIVAYGMESMAEENWMYTGFQMGHINSEYLKSMGVPEVDVIEFMNDWQLRSNNRSNPGLIMKYAKNCGPTFDWIFDNVSQEDKDASFSVMNLVEGGPFVRNFSGIKSWVGTAMAGNFLTPCLQRCKDIAIENGGGVLFETKAKQLVTDETGAVVGAIGEGPDGYVKVNASKGVIISTGGFGSNQDMREDLLYEIRESLSEGEAIAGFMDRDGSGIAMGYWIGARLDPCMGTMDGAYWYPCDAPTDPIGATAALWLNAEGKRYSNEGFGSTELMAMPGAKQPTGMTVSLFDANIEALLKAQPYGHMSYNVASGDFSALHATMDKAYAGGPNGSADPDAGDNSVIAGGNKAMGGGATLYAADDFETLGTYLGYEGEALENFVASIEHYNELCAAGADTDFGKDASLLFPLSTPPYYGFGAPKALGVLMVTVGGLLIDENGAVLGDDYRPIPGLFAAGNASGGRFGWQYFTSIAGQSLTMAHTLGRLTGQYVASL